MNRIELTPNWLRFVPCITGGDDDPNPKPEDQNFGSEALGELLSRLDAKDDATKKLADDLKAAQDLLRDQENARLTAEQQAERDRKSKLREAEKRATDAEAKATEAEKAVNFAKQIGIKYAIEHLTNDEGKAKYTWQDVDTVFDLLKKDDIEFDFTTGVAKGLDTQLDLLAEKKPFLLKTDQKQETPNPSYWNSGTGTPPSGGNTGDHGNNKTVAEYAKLYPALGSIANNGAVFTN